jgi:glycerate kinase
MSNRVRIVLAPDSFKESMTASQAVIALREGVHQVLPPPNAKAADGRRRVKANQVSTRWV